MDFQGTLQAYYLIVQLIAPMTVSFECPKVYGPYTQEECWAVQEWVINLGYQKGDCTLMPIPQDAEYLRVGYLP